MKKPFIAIAAGLVLATQAFTAMAQVSIPTLPGTGSSSTTLEGTYKQSCYPAPAVGWNFPAVWVTNCQKKDGSYVFLTQVPKSCKKAENRNGTLTCTKY